MKVVIDTNVFISGIFWKGPPHQIIQCAEEGMFEICATEETLKEVLSVLARDKFKYLFDEAEASYSDVVGKISSLVTLHQSVSAGRGVVRDSKDDIFLSCAFSSQADFIVSGDKDLLSLGQFQGIKIVTPRIFLAKLERKK